MISHAIPQPYRDQLTNIGRFANTGDRPGDELAVVAKAIDRIRAECAGAHPHLFQVEVLSHD